MIGWFHAGQNVSSGLVQSQGSTQLLFEPIRSGMLTISARLVLNGAAYSAANQLAIKPGPAQKMQLVGPGIAAAAVAQPSQFYVLASDGYGNPSVPSCPPITHLVNHLTSSQSDDGWLGAKFRITLSYNVQSWV